MRVSQIAVWAGGAALTIAAVIVTVDVLCRKFIGVTMSGSDEISGYIFAAATTWAYSYCLLHRANIRIDAFYNLMPRWLKAVFDLAGLGALVVFMSVLTERAVFTLITSFIQDSVSITTLVTPLWIPQFFWASGLVLFMFTLLFISVYAVVALIRGDLATVSKVAGVLSVQEEIEEETHGMDISGGNSVGGREIS